MGGVFVANIDLDILRLIRSRTNNRLFVSELRKSGMEYSQSKRLLRCDGYKSLTLPFKYVGADDQAGPNYTRQAAVNSIYEQK